MSAVAPSGHNGDDWHLLDSFASQLLGDDNAHSSDLPIYHTFQPIYHTFQPRRSWFLGLRRAFAVVSLGIMVTWLVLDVFLPQMNALVPGLKDMLQFESVQFTNKDWYWGQSYAEVIKTGPPPRPPQPKRRITCSCAFTNKSVQVPPSFQLNPKPRNTTASLLFTLIEFCIKGSVSSDVKNWLYALDNSSGAANASVINETYNMMDEFLVLSFYPTLNKLWYALYYANVWNSKTPAVLSLEAWRVAMAAEAYRQASSSYSAARAKLLNEAEFATEFDRDVRWRFQKLGTHYMNALLAGYVWTVARLWDAADDMAGMISIDSLDPTKGENGPIERMTCNTLLSAPVDDLPFKLDVYCGKMQPAGQPEEVCSPSRDDAYDAYINWCVPSDCVLMSTKTGYLKWMQAFAAIGGMYSIFTLFVFSIIWKVVCSIERRVP